MRFMLGGVAAAGIAAGHWLGYVMVAPDPHERHHLLGVTGHRYFTIVSVSAIALAIAGLLGIALRWRTGVQAPSVVNAWARLAVLQMIGFVVLEAAERVLVAGAGAGGLLGEPAVIAGLALQVFVALIAAAFLFFFITGIASLTGRRCLPRAPVTMSPQGPTAARTVPRIVPGTGGPTLRAPPRASFS